MNVPMRDYPSAVQSRHNLRSTPVAYRPQKAQNVLTLPHTCTLFSSLKQFIACMCICIYVYVARKCASPSKTFDCNDYTLSGLFQSPLR
ncbi:unnamed protein product [Periconia digitata]|uniref:Uncharacterized protein n=1 Tax=Periconia digitata TaxID=1303443 RepID=A0A9W4XMU6_9PLEO|nr:unnamed protein product [Periconia digitata]